jgi:hypothetical protein
LTNPVTHFLKYRSAQTLLALGLYALCARALPGVVHTGLYTFSLLIKDLLVWMMPLTVGFFIAHTVSSFRKKAPLLVVAILLFETVSNLACIWYALAVSHQAVAWLPPLHASAAASDMVPFWTLPLTRPAWWGANQGAISGVLLGLVAAWMPREHPLVRLIQGGKMVVEQVLTGFFARLLPLFVLGFAARMFYTGLLGHIATHYAWSALFVTVAILVYISALVWMGSVRKGVSLHQGFALWRKHMQNLLAPAGIAFSTGCSVSTMPWTIQGTARNLDDPALAQAVIPATTNVQQVGDCILQGFMCATIYHAFFGHLPDITAWAGFSVMFALARFATVAMLGGAIFVMLPLYETWLHFTPEMIAILLAMNTVMDPVVTSTNVMGNGAMCRLFERFWQKMHKPSRAEADAALARHPSC